MYDVLAETKSSIYKYVFISVELLVTINRVFLFHRASIAKLQ